MFIVYCLLLIVPPAHAQSPSPSGVPLNEAFLLKKGTTVATEFPTIYTIVSTILPNILIIAGLIMFFIGIGAGFTVISSGANPEKKEKGTAALKGAIIGFVVIFTSFWIIQIIEILTGVKILNPGTLTY